MWKIHKPTEISNNLQKVDDIADIVSGQSPEGEDLRIEQSKDFEFHQGCSFFSSSIIKNSDIYVSKKISKKIASKNSILMSVRAPVGDLNFTDRDISIGRGLISINSKNKQNKFLYFSLLNSKNKIKKLGQGAIFDGLKVSELKTLNIYHPNLKEQKSIASILSKQESIINNLEKVIDNKEKILKEFSHRLLSGEVRLKDENGTVSMYKNPDDNWKIEKVNGKEVNVPKDWDVDLIHKYVTLIKGASIPENQTNYIGKGLKYLKTTELWIDASSKKVTSFAETGYKSEQLKTQDEYIISFDGFNREVGKGTVGLVSCEGEGIVSTHFYKIKEHIDYFYTINLLKNTHIQNEIVNNAVGSISLSSTKHFKNIEYMIPSENERKLISEHLAPYHFTIKNLQKLIEIEKKKFDFLLDNLLSGKYLVENTEEDDK